MDKQKRLTERVNEEARPIVKAGWVHPNGDMSFRVSSASKPGTYHNTFLKWHRNGNGQVDGLHASCAWMEPVTGSQTHCPGNGTTVCWHVLASIIAKLEGTGKRVAFFCDEEKAARYARFGGRPVRVMGKEVWFVVSGGQAPKRQSVADSMKDLYGGS
jgi:hypothetical protein